jgi:hypothetical protein
VALGVAVVLVAWLLSTPPEEVAPDTTGNPPVILPSGDPTTTSSDNSEAPEPDTLLVAGQNGAQITTNDFVNNGTTIPDASNPGRYLLAGDLEYCVRDPQKCRAGTDMSYNVYYDSTTGAFTIALKEEPLGATRTRMEQFLLQTLGSTQSEMCTLNYWVGTTVYVNDYYSGKNLGFSFCPGATPLPQ